MRIDKCSSVLNGAYTVAVASEPLPGFFDEIKYDGISAKVVKSHGYGENAFSVVGEHNLTGKEVSFFFRGKAVI